MSGMVQIATRVPRVSAELGRLRDRVLVEGVCVSVGVDDARWMPDVEPATWIGEERAQEAHARAACAGCPVMAECATWAVATGQEWGVWGGMALHELRAAVAEQGTRPNRRPRRSDAGAAVVEVAA